MNQKVPKIDDVISAYMKERLAGDLKHSKYIDNLTLKVIFDLLTKFSYALLGINVLVILVKGDFKEYKDYFQNKGAKTLLFFLTIIGVLILVTLREIKQSNDIPAQEKKILNFAVDIMRVFFYILMLVFIAPLTLDNYSNEFWEAGAFYIFCIAVGLFIVRKTIKWIYYLGQGKDELRPWKDEGNTEKSQSFKQIADFVQYYLKNNKSMTDLIMGIPGQDIKKVETKQEVIKEAQKKKVLTNIPIDWGQ